MNIIVADAVGNIVNMLIFSVNKQLIMKSFLPVKL